MSTGRTIAALDIGTSKVAVLVARQRDDGGLETLAVNARPCTGLKKGLVVNIEETTEAIRKTVSETQMLLRDEATIDLVHIGVTGDHIRSFNSEGRATIKDGEVSEYDIERARESAEAATIPGDRMILHTLYRSFEVDGQLGIQSPIGMSGGLLQANVHVVTASRHLVENVTKCVKRCGLEVGEVVLGQLASGHAVLTEDELKLGVCLVDIGAGTTDVIVYHANAAVHTVVIPVAGNHVTNDLAETFRTPHASAEELKVRYGCALQSLVKDDETMEVPGTGARESRTGRRSEMTRIIQPRYDELLSLVRDELERSELKTRVTAGYVLTGGGAKIEGLAGLAAQTLETPVRIGVPGDHIHDETGMVSNPIYATGAGLLLYVARLSGDGGRGDSDKTSFKRLWRLAREWLDRHF